MNRRELLKGLCSLIIAPTAINFTTKSNNTIPIKGKIPPVFISGESKSIYISAEALEDIKDWNVDQIDNSTIKEILLNTKSETINRIFGVSIY